MDLNEKLLLEFIRAGGRFLSGSALGDKLGLSRVSIHKHLEQLRSEGFTFSAIRNKGYRLEEEPMSLHPQLLNALLADAPCPFFKGHLCLDGVGSTNSVADMELAEGRPDPFFVVADTQSAGRGRRGRNWFSPAGKNLYLSVALRPSLPPVRIQSITLWLGLQLCEFLRNEFGLPVEIKWPNDLFLHGRKIAGMLTEARVDSEFTRDLVFGLGLNVNLSQKDFPPDLADSAGSLAASLGRSLNLSRLAHAIIHRLAGALREYLEDDYSEALTRLWPEYDFLRGQIVQADGIEGRVLGIASNGSLRIERADGSTLLLHSGEVSLHKD